ncbi:STAS domain-containing protein [Shewanella decolorationis]|jgi:anti-anti-sigma factor|uniref:STAS domain-containing protein n=2 Tax=Shewanella decolorationis TaxID=256839 RepID=A0A5B8QWG3_9GAMM|nr:STAS domain-containing protein [Shewanella decolorationis]ESE41064.1 SpoIIAA family protein [Shewanella decolorationis S12]QDZ90983.1 STAS domain-containing protein [Shewanella decolorationis]GLR30558.1 chemotaxis locus anti-sigma factor antagonist [Shewanella decolorationis]
MSNIQIIVLPERFDFYYHKAFTSDYQHVLSLKDINHIILDFSRVLYLDSSALGMMVLLHRKAQERGLTTAIKGAHGQAEEILKVANMQKIYIIE